ncbi:MAG: ABC transporter substrate-binding protein [Rhodospirillaceae bacterium]|nr:ABC transporter substrate-binding protein [Rhodospirillaceae bacterium]
MKNFIRTAATALLAPALLASVALTAAMGPARAADGPAFPILVPLTGVLALEGQSQRNGALLAFEELVAAAPPRRFDHPVIDTGSNPQIAVQAFERAFSGRAKPMAAMGPIDGNSMLALLPLAAREKVALLAVSGTAKLTELGNAYIFRFFPSDAEVKAAQARYIVEELGRRKIALVYQNTAYGQSGNEALSAWFERLGAKIVYRNSVPVTTKELAGVIAQVKDSGADAVALQLHSGSSALFVGQAARAGLHLPIVGGSALQQPSTAALLQPAELQGVCAETASAPAADPRPALAAFAQRYRARFKAEPDAFALAAYDAVRAAAMLSVGAKPVYEALATVEIEGLAMTYRSDGRGNMAHDAIIVCYDGKSRTPRIAKRYARPQQAERPPQPR